MRSGMRAVLHDGWSDFIASFVKERRRLTLVAFFFCVSLILMFADLFSTLIVLNGGHGAELNVILQEGSGLNLTRFFVINALSLTFLTLIFWRGLSGSQFLTKENLAKPLRSLRQTSSFFGRFSDGDSAPLHLVALALSVLIFRAIVIGFNFNVAVGGLGLFDPLLIATGNWLPESMTFILMTLVLVAILFTLALFPARNLHQYMLPIGTASPSAAKNSIGEQLG